MAGSPSASQTGLPERKLEGTWTNEEHHDTTVTATDSDHTSSSTAPKLPADHPRKDIPGWKWQGTLAVVFLTSLVNG
jgi:L-ascorbate metabolism protein UlaG (beta-lactamase superfamily)